MVHPIRVLVVPRDTESGLAGDLERAAERFTVETASSFDAAEEAVSDGEYDCVVSAYSIPDGTGVELLDTVRERAPSLPFILAPVDGSEAIASEAISAGVSEYVATDASSDSIDEIADTVRQLVEAAGHSDHEATQAALARTHARMEFALEATDATIWEWDSETDTVTTHPDPHHVLETEVTDLQDFLDAVHPDDRPEVREALETARDEHSSYNVEFRLADDSAERWVQDFGESRQGDDGTHKMVGVATDITERKARERDLEQSRERLAVALEVSDAGVWEWDPSTDEVVWHESTERLFGLEPGSFEGTGDAFTDFVPDEQLEAFQAQLADAVPEREPFEGEYRVTRESGDDWWLHTRAEYVDIEELSPRYIGVVTDVTELKQYERTLTTLHDITRQLVRSDSPEEVSRRIVDAANRLLGVDRSATMLYDETAAALVPENVQRSEQSGGFPSISPGDGGAVWEAFVAGETLVVDDLGAAVGGRDLPEDQAVILPLADHGLFVISDEAPDAFDERTRNLAEILAANAEAALDRISRETELERRDHELRERADRLAQLDQVNERVRKIIHELIRATTREEIEEIVSSELVAAERFELACIGDYDAQADRVHVRACAGSNQEYFDAISLAGDDGSEPTYTAAQSRETVTVEGIGHDFRDEAWRQEALVRGYQSVLAVPIGHGDIPYGVLTVYANSPDTFDEETTGVLEELGTAIAHVLRTVVQREALESDQQVELEFEIRGASTTLFTLSDRLEADVSITRFLSQSDTHLAYGTIAETDPETFRETTEAMMGIDRARVLATEGDHLRVELRITGDSVAMAAADHGGAFQELVAHEGTGHISVVFPANAKLNEFIEMFVQRYPNAELSARRERAEYTEEGSAGIGGTVTDRQDEVLRAAYHSGFFDWPRESTGEEIAKSLDISPSAFRENLRRAQRNILDWYVNFTRHHTTDRP